ncbi:helix-turn-helix domain-containing protein [Bacillus sp. 166amftsu]|uniref:helix-turn-helix domain-containing protein n=1 Tax=Bacillus sp. 166amftsu TaxID=1761753 RepID=UPI00089612EC|nr:helix-turn-helix domain-containing protein [Bacillus sp. 166amftsu]SDZ43826.1 IclR helix-turn-helix domain-containing protein [Bacillus sp. 166amftsu]
MTNTGDTEIELLEGIPRELKSHDIAKTFGIAESTVRKYAQSLEKAGYVFRKNENNTRIFTDIDELTFRDLLQARKEAGVNLDMAASVAVIRRQKQESPIQSVQQLINKESKDDLIPHKIRYEIQNLANSFQKQIEQIEEQNQMIISKLQASEETEIEIKKQLLESQKREKEKDQQIEDMQKMIEYIAKRDTVFDKKIEEIYQKAKKPWWKRW